MFLDRIFSQSGNAASLLSHMAKILQHQCIYKTHI